MANQIFEQVTQDKQNLFTAKTSKTSNMNADRSILEKILKKTQAFFKNNCSKEHLNNITLTSDSRRIQTGDIFCLFQLKSMGFGQISKNQHNYEYLNEALLHKPSCIIGDIPFAKALSYGLDDTPYLYIEKLSLYLSEIARSFYAYATINLNADLNLNEFDMVAITGTNGKTSISQFLAQLNITPQKMAIMGTLGTGFLNDLAPTGFTTPDALMLQKQIKQLAEQTNVCVLELSSHGLDQNRADACPIDTAIFSNLTQDHFDYHLHFDNYLHAKSLLFQRDDLRAAILNIDDPASFEILKTTQARHIILTHSNQGLAVNGLENQAINSNTPDLIMQIKEYLNQATQNIQNIQNIPANENYHSQHSYQYETRFSYIWLQSYEYDIENQFYIADIYLEWRDIKECMRFNIPVLGLFNLSNILQAIAASMSLFEKKYLRLEEKNTQNSKSYSKDATKLDINIHQQHEFLKTKIAHHLNEIIAQIRTNLKNVQPVSGRMDVVKTPENHLINSHLLKTTQNFRIPLVVVDYAHTPDALEKTLVTLRQLKKDNSSQKIICVFGCGGNRDASKRKIMGRIAAAFADEIIITDDNPRFESPIDITHQIEQGIIEFYEQHIPKDLISTKNKSYQIIHAREQAIIESILKSNANDIILIAGKGHENYQEIQGQKLAFSDQKVAAQALAAYINSLP